MLAKSVLLLVLLVPTLTLASSSSANAPSAWLIEGAYVTYEQAFVWNGHSDVANMTWLVTRLEAENASLNMTSYTVDNAMNIIRTSSTFTINSTTREVVNSSETTIIGQKWPFWVETDVGIGSHVDIWFGATTITGSETVSALGQQRSSWTVEYDWTANTYMKRWYDKATGIVLKIDVGLVRENTPIKVTETAISTNIDLPPSSLDEGGLTPWTILLIVAGGFAVFSVAIIVALRMKRRHQTRETSAS